MAVDWETTLIKIKVAGIAVIEQVWSLNYRDLTKRSGSF
jgi:hypothetical protein